MTPYDFVQQVFYVQEKVLLDFWPSDDVYKEVLTEANLVLKELQNQEDWLWLRSTRNLGFASQGAHPLRPGPWQHDAEIELPPDVYKMSMLYGDGLKLCRWRIRHELLHMLYAHKKRWEELIESDERLIPEKVFVYYQGANLDYVNKDGLEYGGTFPFSLKEVKYSKLCYMIEPKKWYLDSDGNAYFGGTAASETYESEEDPHIPIAVYKFTPLEDVKPRVLEIHNPFDPAFLEPAPHGFLEGMRYWTYCYHWRPCRHARELDILWDPCTAPMSPLIEVFENDYIKVPFVSAGQMAHRNVRETSITLQPSIMDFELGAIVVGRKIMFNRPLTPRELGRIIVADVQDHLELFHVCNDNCYAHSTEHCGTKVAPTYPNDPCSEVWWQTRDRVLTEIPDPHYVVYRTAELHAQGSPPAQAHVFEIQQVAQKLLSAMRTNNAEATAPDLIDYQPIDFINVV